ncbi:MAG: hypothetical protein H6539_02080 [Bacteroidales bacterium]|nr:hypothetical protein [Bacteroidales bacterium]
MKITAAFVFTAVIISYLSCTSSRIQSPPESLTYNRDTTGIPITIEFTRGESFNHPLMAIWVEDEMGRFVQTLFVAESIGKGVFKHGDATTGKWLPGPISRPAALPYWSHRRGIKNSHGLYLPDQENPVADAYTGATPSGNFILHTRIEDTTLRKFSVYFEINQPWDWNEYWTNNKYPDDYDYKTSSQPALVYMADIDLKSGIKDYDMTVIGHSHYSGLNGDLDTDLSTMTTALDIAKNIHISLE